MRDLSPIVFGLLLLICLPLLLPEPIECVQIPSKRIGINQLYGTVCSDGTERGFEGMPDSIYIERVKPIKEQWIAIK